MLAGDGSLKVVDLDLREFTSGEGNCSPLPCLLGVAGEVDMVLGVDVTGCILERIRCLKDGIKEWARD